MVSSKTPHAILVSGCGMVATKLYDQKRQNNRENLLLNHAQISAFMRWVCVKKNKQFRGIKKNILDQQLEIASTKWTTMSIESRNIHCVIDGWSIDPSTASRLEGRVFVMMSKSLENLFLKTQDVLCQIKSWLNLIASFGIESLGAKRLKEKNNHREKNCEWECMYSNSGKCWFEKRRAIRPGEYQDCWKSV